MIIYQLQDRVLRGEGNLEYPNKVILKVNFEPPEAFGTSSDPSRLAIKDHALTFIFEAITGRTKVLSQPPLEPIHVAFESGNAQIEFQGNVLHIETFIENPTDLLNLLLTIEYLLPTILNINFADPPIAMLIEGQLGETHFRVEHKEAIFAYSPTEHTEIERHIQDTFSYIEVAAKYRRFATALSYLHTASRLMVVGKSPWEFMPEIILNLSKILEILFGSNETARSKLAQLNYTSEEIEVNFIPLAILRSKLDVGHAKLSSPSTEQLQILYRYLIESESVFKELLNRVLQKLSNGSFSFDTKDDLHLNKSEQKDFDRLISTIKNRKSPNYIASFHR